MKLVSINVQVNKKYLLTIMIFTVVLGMGLFPLVSQEPQESRESAERLKYNVAVEAVKFPVFAVDADGKPVYDLKKDEVVFTINGKPMDFQILSFHPKIKEEKPLDTETQEEKDVVHKPSNRVIFLILDSMYNTNSGFKRSRIFLTEIIKGSYPGETFIVLENAPKGGLRHIAGPERDGDKLLAAVSKLKWYPEKYRKFLFLKPKHSIDPLFKRDYFDAGHGPEVGSSYKWTSNDIMHLEKVNKQLENTKKTIYNSIYREKLKHFSRALSQFKYVLQTIDYPKIVFLISEGMAEETLFKRKKSNLKGMNEKEISRMFYFQYLRKVIQAINASGTVLYTISPKRGDMKKSKDYNLDEISLEYLAGKSGGKYFKGGDVKKVAREIKGTTAAYYEVVFTRGGEPVDKEVIDITCNREGITLYSPRYNERTKSYQRMNTVQKKVFAHNVIVGANWSRMVGKIRRVTYEKITSKPGYQSIEVLIPPKMKNREADIFLVAGDTATRQVSIFLKSKRLAEKETLHVKTDKNKAYYFVIIDPLTTYCIYSDKSWGSEKR